MSKQKAGHKKAAPKIERFRNCQGEMLDCLETPIDNLWIKLATKGKNDNGHTGGFKWWGSLALLKTQGKNRRKLGLGKSRSSKSQSQEQKLAPKMELESQVETPCNLVPSSRNPASSKGKQRRAAASYSLGQQVKKNNTNDNNGAMHNIHKENIEETSGVYTALESPRGTMLLLHLPHLETKVYSECSSLTGVKLYIYLYL
jgi:hypothetical protein